MLPCEDCKGARCRTQEEGMLSRTPPGPPRKGEGEGPNRSEFEVSWEGVGGYGVFRS
jgi:hypothetical protein